jgi:hypothetical protein
VAVLDSHGVCVRLACLSLSLCLAGCQDQHAQGVPHPLCLLGNLQRGGARVTVNVLRWVIAGCACRRHLGTALFSRMQVMLQCLCAPCALVPDLYFAIVVD